MADTEGQIEPSTPAAATDSWRIKLGAAVFVLSILAPLAGIPLISGFDLSGELLAAISGGLLVMGEVRSLAIALTQKGYRRM